MEHSIIRVPGKSQDDVFLSQEYQEEFAFLHLEQSFWCKNFLFLNLLIRLSVLLQSLSLSLKKCLVFLLKN